MKTSKKQDCSDSLSEWGKAAQWLASKGLAVFPLTPKTKKPLRGTNGIKDASSDPETARSRWTQHTDANIAIAAGASNLVIVDVDGTAGEKSFTELSNQLGRLPVTVTTITPGKIKDGKHTGKGRHLFFRSPAVPIVAKPGIVPNIDIRSGDTYVVAPPSIHPDGGRYEFEAGKDFDSIEVAELPDTWIEFLSNPEPARTGKPIPETKTPAPSDDLVERRVIPYLASCDPAIQNGTGHKTLFSVANALVYGFCLEPDVAASIAWEHYNPRCIPPWSDNERYDFDRKFTEAAKKPPNKERGYLLNENLAGEGFSGSAGNDLPDWMKEPPAKEKPKKDAKPTNDQSIRRPILINPAELEEKETDWLWPNKIPMGELSLLAGMPGQGKTFWSCYLSAVITQGFNWPDGTPSQKGSVIFFLGEDSIEKTYKPRLRANGADQSKIRFLAGVELAEPGREPGEADFSMRNIGDIEAAIRAVDSQTGLPVRLVVIDPISNHWGGAKENENAEVRAVLSPLNRLAERMKTAFLLIQHTGKGDKIHAQHRVLGSTGIVGQCRNVWGLYPSTEKDHRIFAPIKANLCVGPTAVDFVISPTEPGGRVEIVNPSLGVTGDDLEAIHRETHQHGGRGRKPDRSNAAKEWLANFLKDGRKPAGKEIDPVSGSVRFESDKAGFAWSTIKRTSTLLHVVKQCDLGIWLWSLPVSESSEKAADQNSGSYTPCNFEPLDLPDLSRTYDSSVPEDQNSGNSGLLDENTQKGPKRYRASDLSNEAVS